MECGIQAGVDRQIKLLCGVVCQRDTGGRCLCVVDEHMNVPEGVHCLLYHIFHNGGIVRHRRSRQPALSEHECRTGVPVLPWQRPASVCSVR